MDRIRLLYVTNVIERTGEIPRQRLSFFMLLDNLCHDKQVDVVWAGEDGVQHTLPATYHSTVDQTREYWQANAAFEPEPDQSLPGNVHFTLRYRAQGAEYRADNSGLPYCSEADSGIMLARDIHVMNFGFATVLEGGQRTVPVSVAVRASKNAKVTLHWTTDDWKTTHTTPCQFRRNYWDATAKSNARNPNQYAVQVWGGMLKVDHAYRLQYCIACESEGQLAWDNNFGRNYRINRVPLRVLILNLHCYQEEDQDAKFLQIARAIAELDADVVCLQEVAELWNDGNGDWASNSARIINDRLASPYHLVTDWSHLGFDQYREGVAILSRYPLTKSEARYVSTSQDPYDIHARKVVMAQIKVPHIGLVNVFSVHLSWWENGFEEQFGKLRAWAKAKCSPQVKATLLCGDFNVSACSQGYRLMTVSGEFEDQFLATALPGDLQHDPRVDDPYWQRQLAEDYRIDFVLMSSDSTLRAVAGRTVFTQQDYGRVSDHNGYWIAFEPK